MRGHRSEARKSCPRVSTGVEKSGIRSVSEPCDQREMQDAVGACTKGTWPCLRQCVQPSLSSDRRYLTEALYETWLPVPAAAPAPEAGSPCQLPWSRLLRPGIDGLLRAVQAGVAVAPLRTGPTCTAAGGPASCQPSSSSLTATGGFLSREEIPPFPSPHPLFNARGPSLP